ncbi:MAG: hypothetical protein ACO1OK_00350 [Devosia sp.]
MSDKDLKVLAECVDSRSGRRFKAGEIFDPAPTADQARRLAKAGCLPEGAIGVAEKADAAAERKADAAAKAKADARAKAEAIAAATSAVTAATSVLRDAEDRAGAAQSAEDKANAGQQLAEAKARLVDAEDALAKLSK